MGYDAYTVDVDFIVPPEKVADALAALNAALKADDTGHGGHTSLAEAVDIETGFEGSEDPYGDDEEVPPHVVNGFRLGWHSDDRYNEKSVVAVLKLLAPYANDGSYVRFHGEDDSLFGFRVVGGQLVDEWGDYTWRITPNASAPANIAEVAARIDPVAAQRGVADAMAVFGSSMDWDSETIEHVADVLQTAIKSAGDLPSCFNQDGAAVEFWQRMSGGAS